MRFLTAETCAKSGDYGTTIRSGPEHWDAASARSIAFAVVWKSKSQSSTAQISAATNRIPATKYAETIQNIPGACVKLWVSD